MGSFRKRRQKEEDKASLWTEQAYDALDAGELKTAEKLAAKLQEIGFSSWFEIQALVDLRRDDPEAAIAVLREGLEKAPSVWSLWQLLGNTLSNQNEFEEALRCYESALRLDIAIGARASIEFNRATLLGRQRNYAGALRFARELEALEGIPEGLLWQTQAMIMRSLSHLGRGEELLESAAALHYALDSVDVENEDSYDDYCLVAAWSQGSLALLDSAKYLEAREWAMRALMLKHTNDDALHALRFSDPDAPLSNQWFQVILEGEWEKPEIIDEDGVEVIAEGEHGFFATHVVIARSKEEAESLALEFESPRWQAPLIVKESSLQGECNPTPIGIRRTFGYGIFPRDEAE
ncbi:tetratricopeptide repeat protein [bacterium]|nr:MAG: tetratricopeptide repeat protein [bacterium]